MLCLMFPFLLYFVRIKHTGKLFLKKNPQIPNHYNIDTFSIPFRIFTATTSPLRLALYTLPNSPTIWYNRQNKQYCVLVHNKL